MRARFHGLRLAPKQQIPGKGGMAELGRVGLADHDRTRRLEPRDLHRVLVREVILERRRAEGSGHAGDVLEVLDAQRQSGQRSRRGAARELFVQRARLGHRLVEAGRAKGVELRIQRFDPRDRRRHQLARLEFAPANHREQLASRHPMQISHRLCSATVYGSESYYYRRAPPQTGMSVAPGLLTKRLSRRRRKWLDLPTTFATIRRHEYRLAAVPGETIWTPRPSSASGRSLRGLGHDSDRQLPPVCRRGD